MLKPDMNPKRKRSHYRVYRAPLPMRLIISIVLPFLLFGMLFFGDGAYRSLVGGSLLGVIFTGAFAYGFCFGFWWVWQGVFVNRLIVSNKGIEFHALGVNGFAAWENILEIGWKTPRGRAVLWGMSLNDQTILSKRFLGRVFQYDDLFHRFIPIELFASVPKRDGKMDIELFQETPLGLDIAHYAPHLFSEDSPKRKESPSEPHDDLVQTAPDEQRGNSE